MGFFNKALKATIEIVKLPIDVAKDVVTCGGLLGDMNDPTGWQERKKTHTREKLEEIADILDD